MSIKVTICTGHLPDIQDDMAMYFAKDPLLLQVVDTLLDYVTSVKFAK